MKQYEYLTYQLNVNLSQKEIASGVLKKQVEDAINKHTELGYEFHNQIHVPVTINAGCLGSLTGGKDQQFNVPFLVFRREIDSVQGDDSLV